MPPDGNINGYVMALSELRQVMLNHEKYGKIILITDFHADIKRENAVDRELIKWFAEHDMICVDMLYTQIASNTFLNSRGQNSWIDHSVQEKNEHWYEFSQINIDISEKEKKNKKKKKKEKNRILNGMEPYEDVVRNNWDY